MPRPVHFEIHASEPSSICAFYQELFGWRFVQWGDQPYWMAFTETEESSVTEETTTEMGINGGVLTRQGPPPVVGAAVSAFVVTIDVPDCDAYYAKAISIGGTEALPPMDMGDIGRLAYVKDPDGNIFGMMASTPKPS